MRSTTRSLWIVRPVVVAEVALRQRVDVRPGLVAADLADDRAAHLGVAVRVGGVPDRHRDLGVLLDRLVLGPVDLGVDRAAASSLASTHMTWLAIWPLGSCTAIVPKFLPVLARSRMAGSSMRPRLRAGRRRGEMVRDAAAQRARRRADPVLDGPAHRLLPHGCCENRGDDPGMHVVCCRVTDEFLEFSAAARQRPVDADAAVRLPRPAPRRPVVRVRRPLGRGAGGGRGVPGRARGHPPVGARVRRPRRPAGPRRHRRLSATEQACATRPGRPRRPGRGSSRSVASGTESTSARSSS